MTLAVRLRASDSCEVAPFDDGVALLDLRSNTYFSLNDTGRFVFEALQEPLTPDEVAARVADHYDVGVDECRRDVEALLTDLVRHRLVDRA